MKRVRNFLSFVEIATKIASVFPFLVGVGYTLYRHGSINLTSTLVFFGSMLLFDMTTTALNNHVGRRETGQEPHYSNRVSLAIIALMGTGAAALGLWLAVRSSVVVLLVGIFCFAVGILYNYGPLPISRTPFGELVSGAVMGICILFVAAEISYPTVSVALALPSIAITANLYELAALAVVAMPLVLCIANIMLANNICDVEEDVEVERYTLPFYIGKQKALQVYRLLYILAFVFVAMGVVAGILPWFTVAVVAVAMPVRSNIRLFFQRQDKRQTFGTVISNFLLICGSYTICIWLGIWV